MTPSAATRVFALLGDPVEHSLSPRIHNAALRAAGLDGVYVALRCDADALPGLLRGLAGAGGAGNVTLPHKGRAAECVDRPSATVRRTGACNTFWAEEGRVCGDNTDVAGAAYAVAALLGGSPRGARVLLLGAGGAARAALCALLDGGVAEVVVRNRTSGRARELVGHCAGDDSRVRIDPDPARVPRDAFDLVVNATSLGLCPTDPPPLELDGARVGSVLDLVYARGGTAWVRDARARGLPAADGTEMLIAQAASAWERWWHRPAPIDAMRAAVEG